MPCLPRPPPPPPPPHTLFPLQANHERRLHNEAVNRAQRDRKRRLRWAAAAQRAREYADGGASVSQEAK